MLDQWYGIMPNRILFDKWLKDKEKLLFILISSLCAEKWYCRASNWYLWDKLDITWSRVSWWISSLKKKWYISIEIDKKWGNKRIITIAENSKTYCQKQQEGIAENSKTPIAENGKHNNTIDNNTKEKKIYKKNFSLFWDEYPNKKAKWAAQKAFNKAIKKVSLDDMLSALKKQKEIYNKKSAAWDFVPGRPYPQKRLNNWYRDNEIDERTEQEKKDAQRLEEIKAERQRKRDEEARRKELQDQRDDSIWF